MADRVSAEKTVSALRTTIAPREAGIPCWFMQRIGLRYADPADVTDPHGLKDKWKLLIPYAPIAGQTDFSRPVGFYYDGNVRVAAPGEVCTETYLVAGAFDTEEEVLSFKSYLLAQSRTVFASSSSSVATCHS
ncbi:MAG: hypothetical protein KatS3mg015_1653 [Fimbriimonadales bacterium]|nr:MAG: hypothetical protein KatS3mg015_1653 [Fimbriimonadales bacterium]